MRKFLKVLLPPLIGFTVLFIAVRYSSEYYTLRTDEMGEGTVRSFMAYYRFFWPLLFVVGLLTQFLIIVPVWYKVKIKGIGAKLAAFFILCFICLLFAFGISYIIWEQRSGYYHLLKLIIFMTSIQIVYWVMNILVMSLLNVRLDQDAEKKDIEPTE
ncbi:hypothetical protein [Mucilaginibacter sp.]|jgi:hypothetical protein|uniref:hypothetical protein n=1 Tax=Mucilaginibacter sp. TaxID=1882438 RepID=UPI002C7BF241|nr:hypothetical protein [Mucilaginibacter sp.]HTI59449.1 hypothetical protein [Mucilaginibacter sp.]